MIKIIERNDSIEKVEKASASANDCGDIGHFWWNNLSENPDPRTN